MKKLYKKQNRKSSEKSFEFEARHCIDAGNVSLELSIPVVLAVRDLQAQVDEFSKSAGLLLMNAIIEGEVVRLAGERYKRDASRQCSRWGTEDGYVVYKGQNIPVKRPRVRSQKDKKGKTAEVPLETYAAFQSENPMRSKIFENVMLGVSQRNYHRVVDQFIDGHGISKSSVSRKFKFEAAKKLKSLNERRFDDSEFVAIIIDGVHFGKNVVIAAMGVDIFGRKQLLGLRVGSTENSATCLDLLRDLIDRGLKVDGTYLFVLDGSPALRKAVVETFGNDTAIKRCSVHKKKNVLDKLPNKYCPGFERRFNRALGMVSYKDAKNELNKTVAYLESVSYDAANSLREGFEGLLTLHKLEVPDTLRKSLMSTNLIESAFSRGRELTHHVKRWRNQKQAASWAAAALLEAEKGFRRIRGYKELQTLKGNLKNGLHKRTIDKKEITA